MAIPSGSGTEVLKRAHHEFSGNSTTSPGDDYKILDGVANHIYTILSITCFNTYPGARTFTINVTEAGGTNRRTILKTSVGQDETFIFNDKLVLSGTDELWLHINGNAGHWWVSYIDQDWS